MPALRLVDFVALGYTAATATLLLLTPGNVARTATTAGVAAAVVLGVPIAVARAGNGPAAHWIRALYPLPLLLCWWGQLEWQIPLLTGGYGFTDELVRADLWLFGGHPTALVSAWFNPPLDELLALCYLSYYLFLAVPVVLAVRGRFEQAVAGCGAILLTYAGNFALFLVLPAQSPPQILDRYPDLLPAQPQGYVLVELIRTLQSNESVTGAAFPSSHVAGSLACTLVALRYVPRLGRVLVPLLAGMCLSTVYLGYHHAMDPLAGLALGAGAYAAACWPEPDLVPSPDAPDRPEAGAA